MLIFEGSDCVGKTTAARRCVELVQNILDDNPNDDVFGYPIRYQHMTRQNSRFNFFTHYRDMLSMYAVQDRFHIGALVWHEGVMCEASLRVIEGWLAALGTFTVIFTAEDDDWYKYFLESKDTPQLFDTATLIKANDRYREMVAGIYEPRPYFDANIVVGHDTWPTDAILLGILRRWFERVRYAEC